MYGLWLFKEIKTEYGYCKVEIYRKGYDGSELEIGALAANSLTISLENLSEITAPIGKSVCSFSIIDTDQVDYDAFFTPDATAYKVVVSSRVRNGAYITRWSGYVTPDFFAENLSYRTPISISARDNIGYLNDVDFDLVQSAITIRELITKAFARIASDYPMSLEFVSQKQTAEGILAIDATISTAILKEMSWYEALETVLHDLGLQMRWVDNNTIAVMDLSQIPEYYTTQEFNFIQSSGYREILPAWRQLSQSQDYGLRENFFDGWMRSDNLSFIKSVVIRPPNAINWTTDIACYAPNNWGVAREAFTIDPAYYGSNFNKKIYFSGVSADYPTTTYLSWRQPIQVSDLPMQITFKAFNSVIYPSEKYTNISTPSGRRLEVYNPMNAVHGQKVGEYLQLGLKMNVLLHSGLDTYVLKNNWELTTDDGGNWQLNFSLPKVDITYVEGGEASGTEPREEEVTINIGTIPYSGDLELRIYGYYVIDKHNYWEDDYSVTDYTFDWEKCVTYINEPVYSFNTEDAETGQNGGTIISELHNVARKEEYTFGEIPENSGGSNAYAGGIVDANGKEINGFQRNADGSNYNLLELVGREIIHFNKKNYNKLSGTIKNLDKEPLYFNKLFVREGKTYMPFSCSLNVISNEMNITTMQEVEPYVTESFTEIKSEVVSGGGAKVGGGNNTVLQYSAEAGNAKRIYELQSATTEETKVAEIIIDNVEWPEAKKLPLGDLTPLFKRINVGTEDNPQWAVIPVDYNGNPVGIVSDTFITSGGRKGSSGTESSFNRLDSWDNYNPNAGDVLSAVLGYELKTRLDNIQVGFDESKLKEYLDTNEYITKTAGNELYAPLASFNELNNKFNDFLTGSDVDNTINKWKELEAFLAGQTETSTLADLLAVKADKTALEAVTTRVTTVEGYFTNGAAKNALKLGGQLPEYYATASALSTHISTYNTFVNSTYAAHITAYNKHIAEYNTYKSATDKRLADLEALWAIDEENNGLYPKSGRGIWSESYITAGGVGTSGGGSGTGGGLIQNVYGYADLGGTFNNNILTDTFNAYTINYLYNEVVGLKDGSKLPDLSGKYLPLSGGTINNASGSTVPLTINTSDSLNRSIILFKGNNANQGEVGYAGTNYGVWLYNFNSGGYLGIKDDGTPHYNLNTLIHSGNVGTYALPINGGNLQGDIQTKSFKSGMDSLGVYIEGSSVIALRFQYQKASGRYDQLLMQSGVLQFNGTQVALVNSNITGHASSATKLYASDAQYAFDGANPSYLKMRYNVLGDNSWYLSVYPETPLSVSVDKAKQLVTARSIWGQNFDGTGDITGPAKMQYLFFKNIDGTAKTYFGRDSATNDNITLYIPTANDFLVFTNAVGRIRVNSSGNILIGTTDIITTTNDILQVDGNGVIRGNLNILQGDINTKSFTSGTDGKGSYIEGVSNSGLRIQYKTSATSYVYDSLLLKNGELKFNNQSVIHAGNVAPVIKQGSSVYQTRISVGGVDSADFQLTYASLSGIADKLSDNTAYTAWGQTFFENGVPKNVTGGLKNVNYIQNNSTNGFLFGERSQVSATDGGALIYTYGETPISFWTKYNERMKILGNGNVLIGTTDDNSRKLNVYGTGFFTAGTTSSAGVLIGNGGNAIDGVARTSNTTYVDLWLNYTSNGNVILGYGGGNTIIGGSSVLSDAKLSVHGNIVANGYINNALIGTDGLGLYIEGGSTLGLRIQYQKANGKYDQLIIANGTSTFTTNVVANGAITAGSDARYKTRLQDVAVDIETIANAPLFNFKWNDREDDRIHLGTTAQYWAQTNFKNAVIPTTDEKLWTMSYSQIAMGNTIVLARELLPIKRKVSEIDNLKNRLHKAEKKIEILEQELNQYRRA